MNGQVLVTLDAIPLPGQEITYIEDARIRDKNTFDPKNLVYLDTHILVANKPSGMLTVPYQKGDKGSFDQQLRSYLAHKTPKGSKRKKGALPALMIVHRIDKGTSGQATKTCLRTGYTMIRNPWPLVAVFSQASLRPALITNGQSIQSAVSIFTDTIKVPVVSGTQVVA